MSFWENFQIEFNFDVLHFFMIVPIPDSIVIIQNCVAQDDKFCDILLHIVEICITST